MYILQILYLLIVFGSWIKFSISFRDPRLDQTLGSLIHEKGFVPLTLQKVRHCYDPQVKNQTINIFDPGRRWSSVVKFFYDAFPENEINAESIENLLNSTREMVRHCLTMTFDRSNYADGHYQQVKYGFTQLSDKSDDYHLNWPLAGAVMFPRQLTGQNYGCSARGRLPLPDSFDWKRRGKVTPVKNQARCDSCWAFAAVGALESAYLVHGRTTDGNIDLSEQQLIGCVREGYGCRPRPVESAYEYVLDYGLAFERQVPYEGRNSSCRPTWPTGTARIRGYCSRGIYTDEILNDQDLKRTLYDFGPLTVILSSRSMRNYRSGIINDLRCNSGRIDHSAVLVGYTPNAWILKNSWGQWWGERGFFRLARNQNMCAINTQITYPLV